MTIKEIKNGAAFIAKILGTLVKGHVFVHPSKRKIFLCQNNKHGNQSPNLLGYTASWQVEVDLGGNILWSNQDVSGFKLTNLAPRKISIKDFKEIADWSFKTEEGLVKFGCGAVTLPQETIQNFVAVKSLPLLKNQIQDYIKVINILAERGVTLSTTDWKVLTAQFTK